MTRLIDADALTNRIEADKKQDNISPGNFFLFKAYIMNAPTIEPDGDTISRQDAILAITGEPPEAHYPSWYADRIKALPSVPDSRQPGKWTDGHGNEMFRYCHGGYCSVCGEESEDLTDYCGNCGAPMIVRDGEDNDE